MGLLLKAFERKSVDFTEKLAWLNRTASGVAVGEESALRMTAVWACVRVIAEDVATLPLFVFERLDRGKRRATEHRLHRLLHDQPNDEMTALQFREALTAHVLTWGNAYAYIVRNARGEPEELWPLLPDRTRVGRDPKTRKLYYETTAPNAEQRWILQPEQVLHIAGLGFDGRSGYSPIRMHAQAIGLGLAAEEFGARFFGQGLHLGGVFEHPGSLSETAYGRLKTELAEKYAGLGRSHLAMILEEGMKFERLGIPPEEAQFLQLRQFQVEDIARIYRMPPHKIQHLLRSTFSNIENEAIGYVRDTLRPWLIRWEQAIKAKLVPPAEYERYFAEHVVEGLLRGDTQARFGAYRTAIYAGFMSRAEARERENLPFVEGTDALLEPLNMQQVVREGA